MLFIKRSINPQDRWSGHVALPGGRQEDNETTKETSVRETMEEVGLDLTTSDYTYIGSLDDRYTMPINLKPFLIATHSTIRIFVFPRLN
jgi:8-oxo-dGTP pyrophosphatase MutT (NUDIX family)